MHHLQTCITRNVKGRSAGRRNKTPAKNVGIKKEMKSSGNGKMKVNLEDMFFLSLIVIKMNQLSKAVVRKLWPTRQI